MTQIDSIRTDYALTFLTDTARDSDINPDQISRCHGFVADELSSLRAREAVLVEALTFYANEESWEPGIPDPMSILPAPSSAWVDEGTRARYALATLDVPDPKEEM